ncbi:MAG: N-acetylmuramoyl-L-alanine amidase [Anaerolineaceae bacterium]|nr:MAG: N-acetylmuramoyl-L-alanine amidase [Anaerolineaceae bacterium]
MAKFVGDPGHGGDKPGAVFDPDVAVKGDEIEEEDINLEVMLMVANLMREKGHDFLLTRERDIDISLAQRKAMISRFRPDAFISVHCNASVSHNSHGVEAFYRDDLDYPLALAVQKPLAQMTGMKDRGVFQDINQLKKRLTVLDDSENTPATLLEIGFIDNPKDQEYLLHNLQTVAEIIANSLDAWERERGKA